MSASHNRFSALADLADSSDSEQEQPVEQVGKVEQMGQMGQMEHEKKSGRVWNTEAPKRSPRFSRVKPELHFLPDEPPRIAVQEGVPPILTSYPSLMERGTKHAVERETAAEERGSFLAERGSAMAWAEKVKQSLEKAEAARKPAAPYQPSEDFIASLGKLSFFRRTNVADIGSKAIE